MENVMLAFMGLGMGEVILILAIVLIMFGAKKLPELAKGLGKGIKEFKRASTDIQDEMDRTYYEEDHRTHRPESGERVAKETSSKDDAVTVESTTESDTSKT